MSDQYLGEIRMFAGNFAPYGWMLCQGQILPIAQYSALFSLLGTYYGGNGTSNFGLPNLIGKIPVHQGTSPSGATYFIGEMGGAPSAQLLLSNLPSHAHPIAPAINTGSGSSTTMAAGYPAVADVASSNRSVTFGANPYNPTFTPGKYAPGGMTGPAGGTSQPFDIQNPYLTVTFIIAFQGEFPVRQ